MESPLDIITQFLEDSPYTKRVFGFSRVCVCVRLMLRVYNKLFFTCVFVCVCVFLMFRVYSKCTGTE